MPVPESSYSRRYGRDENSYSSYARSTSTSGLGRSSYLSSYGSKSSSTLPPRPPSYEIRKYTDSTLGFGSRYLSSSATRARDYGSGSSSSYRASVSPTRASSSIRRQLESTAPSIAERIKAMELADNDDSSATNTTPMTRMSRYSTMRSRDSPVSTSKSYTSAYTRDRSGSKDYSTPFSSSLSRGDSSKSSTENLRNRASPSGTSTSLSRSGSGKGVVRNGISHLGSTEVNSTSSESATSASNKGVTVATTTKTTTTTSVNDDDNADNDENKCAKDLENNDSDSVGSSSSASSSVSVTTVNSPNKVNGFTNSSSNLNGNGDASVTVERRCRKNSAQVTTPVIDKDEDKDKDKDKMANDRKTVRSAAQGNGTRSRATQGSSSVVPGISADKDSNGNPISIDTFKPITKDKHVELVVKGSGIATLKSKLSPSGTGSSSVSPVGASRAGTKCESDNNANILQTTATPTATPTRSADSVSTPVQREKSPYDAVLNYTPPKLSAISNSTPTALMSQLSPSITRKYTKSTPKVIYHTIEVEKPKVTKEASPEPVSYVLRKRPSLDGSAPKLEIKNVSATATDTPPVSESVCAEFKVTLPKLKPASNISSRFESVHNNKSANNSSEEDVEECQSNDKSKLVVEVDIPMSKQDLKQNSRESSPALKKISVVNGTSTRSSITPEKVKKEVTKEKEVTPTPTSTPTPNSPKDSNNSSRESTPTPTPLSRRLKSSSPITGVNGTTTVVTNGEVTVDNINVDQNMGPHSSKYAYSNSNGVTSIRDSPNRNEERPNRNRYGNHLTAATNASDSSDNDSDALSSSPQLGGGRFRAKDGFEKAGLTGLRNIGNTCFMNTVLQCLSNTKPLLEYVVRDNYEVDINRTTSGMKGALIRAFGELIHELWREQRVVDTSAFKDQIQRFAPRFMGYSQQDAQEFLRYLLEGMHEDVNRITAKPSPIHTDIDDSLSDNEKAIESWRRYLRYESSKIVDMFVGQFKSTLKCTVCGHCSVTFDPFWDLSLPIPGRSSNVKLSQCFELLAKEEVLDGDEKPTCAKCQRRQKCTKSLAIQKFPKILVVHLKRFSLAERYRGKLSTLVDYPLNGLDLNPFSATRGQVGSYNLYGVANHSGSTYSGHYIAYCKHPYSGEWHCYNDSRVSPIGSHSVVSSEGYVLFYEQAGQSSLL